MKKRIYLPLLSLILVFSLFSLVPAARVFVKELYDRSFGFAKKLSRVTTANLKIPALPMLPVPDGSWLIHPTPLWKTNTTDTMMLYILLKATLTGRCGLSVPAVIFKMGTITSAATSIMSA